MALQSLVVPASEFKKHYGKLSDDALKAPVIIQKHNRNSLVVMAYSWYEELQRRLQDYEDEKLLREIKKAKAGKIIEGHDAVTRLKAMISE